MRPNIEDQNYRLAMGLDIPAMFTAVGANYQLVVDAVMFRRQEILDSFTVQAAA